MVPYDTSSPDYISKNLRDLKIFVTSFKNTDTDFETLLKRGATIYRKNSIPSMHLLTYFTIKTWNFKDRFGNDL